MHDVHVTEGQAASPARERDACVTAIEDAVRDLSSAPVEAQHRCGRSGAKGGIRENVQRREFERRAIGEYANTDLAEGERRTM